MTEATITEAFDEWKHVAEVYQKWITKHQHLQLSSLLMCDDINPSFASGYLAFAGRKDRLLAMASFVEKEIKGLPDTGEQRADRG